MLCKLDRLLQWKTYAIIIVLLIIIAVIGIVAKELKREMWVEVPEKCRKDRGARCEGFSEL